MRYRWPHRLQGEGSAEVTLGIGPVKGKYRADVKLSDLDPPRAVTLSGAADGALGHGAGEGRIILTPRDDGGTSVAYKYDAEIGGKVASIGGRLLTKMVPYARLADLDLVIPSRRHDLGRILDKVAAEAGITLNPRLKIDTLSAVCEVVATTDLITILPGIALQAMLAAGRIKARRLRAPTVAREAFKELEAGEPPKRG
ncbi:MAG TPA: SRPBCC domain-containing protein [Nitrobacter sp.]|jgi:hypothetical protein|nr:SRPBCC domain-containing protein [Nitrobacter sp.]